MYFSSLFNWSWMASSWLWRFPGYLVQFTECFERQKKWENLCICTCIYKVYACRLCMYFSLLYAQNILLIGSLWKSSWLMHLRSCVETDVCPCGYWSAASAGPGGIWPMPFFLRSAGEMSQRDHTSFLRHAVRLRSAAWSAAQGSGWPWRLADFVQRRCLTLVHGRWEGCRWAVRVCELKPCKIRKVKPGRTESAELARVSQGLGTKYWPGIYKTWGRKQRLRRWHLCVCEDMYRFTGVL